MSTVPDTVVGRIEFGETHNQTWLSRYAQIGLSQPEAEAIKAATNAARDAYQEAQLARDAAKTATLQQQIAVDDLARKLAAAVKKIRLYAETTNNPAVYALAAIPAPQPPAPLPPPSQPTDLSVGLEPGGAIRLIFKAVSPDSSGATTYIVRRRLANESGFRVIGSTGTSRGVRGLPRGYKAFIDETLPAGSNNFQYVIQGQRGDVFGVPSETLTVTIGVGGDGQPFAQIAPVALAA